MVMPTKTVADEATNSIGKEPNSYAQIQRDCRRPGQPTLGRGTIHSRIVPPPVSFIFVVCEIIINYGNLQNENASTKPMDIWGNVVPPKDPRQYAPEERKHVSPVMRFSDGIVSLASSDYATYDWTSHDDRREGCIVTKKPDSTPSSQAWPVTKYKSASVFSCNPLLPVVVVQNDVRIQSDPPMHALHFLHSHEEEHEGVSRAVYPFDQDPDEGITSGSSNRPRPSKFVASSHSSWMPGLVPETYRCPYPQAVESRGLGGELAVVLGLMAFHASKEHGYTIKDVFLGKHDEAPGLWADYTWRGNCLPPGYCSSADEPPRGYLVHACLDPENLEGSTVERLRLLEWQDILVRD